MIRDAGFDGVRVRFINREQVRAVTTFLRDHGLSWQAQCYPHTSADLAKVLDLVAEFGADDVNLNPKCGPTILRMESRSSRGGLRWPRQPVWHSISRRTETG
jgi:hypothetical protein